MIEKLLYQACRVLINFTSGTAKKKLWALKSELKIQVCPDKLQVNPKLSKGIKALGLGNPICWAPLTSMHFGQSGSMAACCISRNNYIWGTYPKNSLTEVWFGKRRQTQIKALENHYFELGCWPCCERIMYENPNLHMQYYNKPKKQGYPSKMEFELSNICNLECIMCGGQWSSSIRAHREKMPPIKFPYDDKFVKELEEFIPHLECATFVGGEPFLIPIYYKIWDLMAKLNKNIEIELVTNGTTYNEKVQNVLDSLPNMKITVSFQSFNKEVYESIMRNACFETTFENIKRYIAQNRLGAISICPMKHNIYEVPEYVKFCEANGVKFLANTVVQPLGGYVKNIHKSGKEAKVFNGTKFETLQLSANEELIEDFTLSSLTKEELLKIKEMFERTENACSDLTKTAVSGIRAQVASLIKEKTE
jgi:MoaA/NifB/PqqE/SkfB family radical SAM enzyme